MLTAQQIHEKSFSRDKKGYNIDEVDLFLDEVIVDFDKLSRENQELKARIEALNKQVESYRGMENSMMHMMVTVHKAAEEIEEKAKKEAEEMYAKTRQQADAMADRAQKEYDQILNTASAEADRIVRDARKELKEKQEAIVELHELLSEFKTGVKDYAEELITFADKINDPEPIQAILPTFAEEDAPAEETEEEPAQEPVNPEGMSANEVVDSLVNDLKKQDEQQEKVDYVAQYVNGVERSKQQAEEAEPEEEPAAPQEEDDNQAVFYGPVDADDGYDNNF